MQRKYQYGMIVHIWRHVEKIIYIEAYVNGSQIPIINRHELPIGM
jgi:hypothetical protein